MIYKSLLVQELFHHTPGFTETSLLQIKSFGYICGRDFSSGLFSSNLRVSAAAFMCKRET
jgi:hypothetical protein